MLENGNQAIKVGVDELPEVMGSSELFASFDMPFSVLEVEDNI